MRAELVARAVLYEGFTLYPYRPSALKNRRRLLFGTLFPPAWALAHGEGDPSTAMVECLLVGEAPQVNLTVRFLRLDGSSSAHEESVDARRSTSFQRDAIHGSLEMKLTPVGEGVFRFQARVSCTSACASGATRDDAESVALGAAHLVLRAEGAQWISLLDPPPALAAEAAACARERLYAVLVGDDVLASPIALDDRPQVAPESRGDFYDATEVEEMLCLRVATLTAAEKDEVRAAGGAGRDILDRVEALSPDDMLSMHGARRGARTEARFAVGDEVRIRPGAVRADALDVVLAGMAATVVSIEETVEGELLACVTIDADPGKDLGEHGFPGHRFFFRESELERRE
jgi:hypothetical protein